MPLSRHGINRMDTGPLLRCSFEETPDILCDAAMFGEFDNGKGVSQNIMTGQLPQIGTGSMTVLMAPSMMHPRDLCVKQHTQTRLLKSSIRVRNTPQSDLEYMDIEQMKHEGVAAHNDIETPFRAPSNKQAEDVDMMESIFSQPFCQAPYIVSEIETKLEEIPQTKPNEYRPSTPSECAEFGMS